MTVEETAKRYNLYLKRLSLMRRIAANKSLEPQKAALFHSEMKKQTDAVKLALMALKAAKKEHLLAQAN
jgi:hypothetical protein